MSRGSGSGFVAEWPARLGTAPILVLLGSPPAGAQESEALADAGLFGVLSGLAGGPREAVSASFVVVAIVVGLAALVLAVAGARAAIAMRRRLKAKILGLQEALSEARGLLAAEPHVLLVWKGTGTAPAVSGQLPDIGGLPTEAERLEAVDDWLQPDSALSLKPAINALRGTGTPFSLFVNTQANDRLIVDGFAAAGTATIKIRPLAGSSLEALVEADAKGEQQRETDSLKAALSKAPVLAWLRDRSGHLDWVNPAYAAAVGSEAGDNGDAAQPDRGDIIPPEKREAIAAAVAKGATAHERIHAVVAGTRNSYDVFEGPAPVGSAGIAINVTELDRVKDELKRHIAAHARTLDQMATAVAIFGPDQRLKFFNAAYVDLWKLDEAWLRQEPTDGEILDHLRDHSRLPEQADYRGWKTRRLDAYKAVSAEEDWWHLPDGQSLRVVVEPHPFGGVTHLYENVTEKLALESRYNALFSVQRETLDNLHEGAALFGSDGRLKLSNPSFAKIWQLEPKDLENQPHMDSVIAVCRELTGEDEHWDILRSSVGAVGGERRPADGRIKRPDGVVLDYASVPLPDGATLFTYVDVSDSWGIEQALRERNEALLAADRLKTEFISHVSYELRAPLTSIKGFADLLSSEAFGAINDKQREYVGYIQNSSEKLEQLIDDILDLATIDAGVMQLEVDQVRIADLLQASGGLLSERAQTAGVSLDYEIPDDFETFEADERRVKQILYNLLSNAIGFSPPGSTVTVGARQDGNAVMLWVSDRGRGIAPEVRDRVFERFVTMTEGSNHRGSGLGLSVVKSFVELHGGSVDIESDEGIGTTVRCRLPLKPVVPTNEEDTLLFAAEPLIEPILGPQAGSGATGADNASGGAEDTESKPAETKPAEAKPATPAS